jgi:hypothetical protein
MANMELLGSPEVHRALGELIGPLTAALGHVYRLRENPDATVGDYEALYSSEEMQTLAARVGEAEGRLRDLMRDDLGHGPLGRVELPGMTTSNEPKGA